MPRRFVHELPACVGTAVNFSQSSEPGVGAEDEVNRVAVHLMAPVARSRPSKRLASLDVGFHSVPMSSRLTKKSLVSVPVA